MNVLVVEDSPADQTLILSILRDCGKPLSLSVASTAKEAIATLIGTPGGRRRKRFDLVLLDLNLCEAEGQQVLAAIRSDAGSRSTPVVVFTSSTLKSDIETCWQLRANWYVVKPLDLGEFIAVLKRVVSYWWSVYHELQAEVPNLTVATTQEFLVEGAAFP